MRLHLLLLPALALPLFAQDDWEGLIQNLQGERLMAAPSWFFLHHEGFGRAALLSETLFPARAAEELRKEVVSDAALSALGRRGGEGAPPEWALVDPSGEVRLQGRGEPTARALLEAMEATGWRPRWLRRQAFLAEHPDHGDAAIDGIHEAGRRFLWLRLLLEVKRQKGSALSVSWSAGESVDPEVAKALTSPFAESEVVRPCLEIMDRFRDLPAGDPERSKAWREMWSLGMGGASSSPQVLDRMRGLLRGVEAQLRRSPSNEALWDVWVGFAGVMPEADPEALVAGLEPAPGVVWPTPRVAYALVIKQESEKSLARAEAELSGGGDRIARLRAWGPVKLSALISLKRFEEARQWILEARRQDRGALGEDPIRSLLEEKDPHREELEAALAQEPPEPPASPGQTRRLVLLGAPIWASAFAALERHPTLDAWSRGGAAMGELAFERTSLEEERALRRRFHLPEGPRWLLLAARDGEPLAQGAEAPNPARLAELLRAEEPPLLERLEAFARSHPDHREAKERLVERLAERMPHPRLELKLAQACAALGEASILRGEDFQPQLPLWEAACKQALPEAEARLSRWPESLEAWMAWMDWQSVRARPEAPLDRLHALAVWKTVERGGPGPLPLDVAAGVARRLEQAKRWKDLADWGLHQWEGGWRRAMGWGREAKGAERPWEQEQRQKVRKDLAGLAKATLLGLQLSGRKAEAKAFQDELKGGDSGLLAGMGREKR